MTVSLIGHRAAGSLIRRGGDQVARLDARPRSHKLILMALPLAIPLWFDASTAGDLDATLELRVRDPGHREPACFALNIADGRCEVSASRPAGAGATVTVGADDMIRLVSGAASWPQLLSSGRLELSGDPFLALRFPSLFRLPATNSSVRR